MLYIFVEACKRDRKEGTYQTHVVNERLLTLSLTWHIGIPASSSILERWTKHIDSLAVAILKSILSSLLDLIFTQPLKSFPSSIIDLKFQHRPRKHLNLMERDCVVSRNVPSHRTDRNEILCWRARALSFTAPLHTVTEWLHKIFNNCRKKLFGYTQGYIMRHISNNDCLFITSRQDPFYFVSLKLTLVLKGSWASCHD